MPTSFNKFTSSPIKKVGLQLHETSHHPSLNDDLKTSIWFKWPHRRNAAVVPRPSLKASLASLPVIFLHPQYIASSVVPKSLCLREILKESTGNLGKWHPDRSYLDTIGAFAFIPVYNKYKTKVRVNECLRAFPRTYLQIAWRWDVIDHWIFGLWVQPCQVQSQQLSAGKALTGLQQPQLWWETCHLQWFASLPLIRLWLIGFRVTSIPAELWCTSWFPANSDNLHTTSKPNERLRTQ